jgi:hypothetical protein
MPGKPLSLALESGAAGVPPPAALTLMLLLRRSCVAHESTVIAYETRLADPNRTGAMRGKMCELCTGKSARRRESGKAVDAFLGRAVAFPRVSSHLWAAAGWSTAARSC